jgi:hypothetical protein
VKRYGLLRFGGDFVQRGTCRRVDHGHDVPGDGIREILLVEGTHQEDGLANACVAERNGFVQLHDRKAKDFCLRLEELGDVRHTHAVAVVLDHREDRTRSGTAENFLNIVAKVFAMNFHPGIEGSVFRNV